MKALAAGQGDLERHEAEDLRRAFLRNRVPPMVVAGEVVFIIRTDRCDLIVPAHGPAVVMRCAAVIERSGWGGTHVAARIARRHPSTLRRWCADGLIPPAHWRQPGEGRHREYDLDFVRHLVAVLSGEGGSEGT